MIFTHLAGIIWVHAEVGAHIELALEQLHTDDTKHEDEQDSDDDNVTDGLHWHDHTLYDLFQPWNLINVKKVVFKL